MGAAPYHELNSGSSATDKNAAAANVQKQEQFDRASLIFVRSTLPRSELTQASPSQNELIEPDTSLRPGIRFRAKLESSVNTAVSTPVIAVNRIQLREGRRDRCSSRFESLRPS